MDGVLRNFIALLRRNGIPISTAESIDAFKSLRHIGVSDQTGLRAALETALIKRSEDLDSYRELFALYFSSTPLMLEDLAEGISPLLQEAGIDVDAPDWVGEVMDHAGSSYSQLTRLLLEGSWEEIEALISQAAHDVELQRMVNRLQVGYYTQQILQQMGFAKVEGEMENLKGGLTAAGVSPLALGGMSATITQATQDLRTVVRRFVQRELNKQNLRSERMDNISLLENKDFFRLDESEIKLLRRQMVVLADKLKKKVHKRERRKNRGRLDLRKILRNSAAYDGAPAKIYFRRKKPKRPELVVMCDVSGSVQTASKFMLSFVYALQDCFSKVRSFVFVGEIGECTDVFKNFSADDAVQEVFKRGVIRFWANSDYGFVFKSFEDEFLESISSRTTVIVLGDGRNNYNTPEVKSLKAIAARANSLVWFNPEDRTSWGLGDSEMHYYAPICNEVHTVSNLTQLQTAIEKLVL